MDPVITWSLLALPARVLAIAATARRRNATVDPLSGAGLRRQTVAFYETSAESAAPTTRLVASCPPIPGSRHA